MSELTNVTVVREANVYFDGGVTSRTVQLSDGSRKTLGIMQPGDYAFTTDTKEIMEILSGELAVLLPGADEWRSIRGGEAFEVPAGETFRLRVTALTDYCCSFIESD